MANLTTSPSGAGGGVGSLGASSNSLRIKSPIVLAELRKIFGTLTRTDTLPVANFKAFLANTQKVKLYDDLSGNDPGNNQTGFTGFVSHIFHPSQSASAEKLLADDSNITFDEFVAYFSAPTNNALALPDPKTKDWNHPLSAYFISSSHNTYLTGHQLYGTSTTDGYKSVLRRGCRCIEIDVWDGDDGEPEVFHGYTLTKEISFRDVCKAVAKYSFSAEGTCWEGGAGEGPVIISLECHAGPEQQEKMVRIMKEEWKDMLVQGIQPEDVTRVPSPMELRRKILVKAKYLPPPAPTSTRTDSIPRQVPRVPTRRSSSSSSSSESELEEIARKANKAKPPKTKVTRTLSELGIYCSAHHFPSKEPNPFLHRTSQIPNHCYSFSEKVFASLHQQHADHIFLHNKEYLMRVYPFGLRFSSSNGDPTTFWRRGCQLVALNWQKCDQGMMLNEGMFAGEGGYVLKPKGYRPGDVEGPVKKTLDLTIEFLAAAELPMPEDDDTEKGFKPYVKVELHVDEASGPKGKTKAKRGTSCSWGGEKVVFSGVRGVVDKLGFVRFKVHDEEFGRDDLAAWACIRLDRLQEGYRFLSLFNNHGDRSNGHILIKVTKRLY